MCANEHLAKGVFGATPRVVELDVNCTQLDPNVVYVAQTYNRAMDIHDFEGVYGNYDSALHASGPKGQPLMIKLL